MGSKLDLVMLNDLAFSQCGYQCVFISIHFKTCVFSIMTTSSAAIDMCSQARMPGNMPELFAFISLQLVSPSVY